MNETNEAVETGVSLVHVPTLRGRSRPGERASPWAGPAEIFPGDLRSRHPLDRRTRRSTANGNPATET